MNVRLGVAIHCRIFFATILSVLMTSLLLPVLVSAEDYEVHDAPLKVSYKKVRYKPVLPVEVQEIVAGSKFAAFSSNRELWIRARGTNLAPLSKLAQLPVDYDWYEKMCLVGEALVVSVALYPEAQQIKELATQLGGYRSGPKPIGLLVVNFDPLRVSLITELEITQRPPVPEWLSKAPPEMVATPNRVKASMQSCHWDGKQLIIGSYGHLAEVDLQHKTAKLLDVDFELSLNRLAILNEKEGLHVSVSEGGVGGSSIRTSWTDVDGKHQKIGYSLLNDYFADADSLLRYQNRLLASGERGVVQIHEVKRSFTHFRIGTKKSELPVYGLKAINGALWGVRKDGAVRIDLENHAATVYQLDGQNVSNDVNAVSFIDGQWYVATRKQLVTISIE